MAFSNSRILPGQVVIEQHFHGLRLRSLADSRVGAYLPAKYLAKSGMSSGRPALSGGRPILMTFSR